MTGRTTKAPSAHLTRLGQDTSDKAPVRRAMAEATPERPATITVSASEFSEFAGKFGFSSTLGAGGVHRDGNVIIKMTP